jgi:hypothetical protein
MLPPEMSQTKTGSIKKQKDFALISLSRLRLVMLVICRERSARAGSGMERRKWVRNVAFATRAILGRWRRQQRGCTVREVGREARSSQARGRKRPSTSRVAVKAKKKKRLWRSHLGKRASST